MSLELVLNELSFTPLAASVADARTRMAHLQATILRARKYNVSRSLRADRELMDILLAPDYPVRKWLNDPAVDRESRQYVRSLTSRYPLLDGLPSAQSRAGELECHVQNHVAAGLLVAYLLDGLVISLCADAAWLSTFVTVRLSQFVDDAILETDETLRHASLPSHIDEHREWISARVRLPDPRDGKELWQQCANRYPELHFCAVVENQLVGYLSGSAALLQIMKRLSELNRYAAQWRSGPFAPDSIGSKITSESAETLRQFAAERTILCPDAIERVFSWHSRFTPSAGRLYFYPDEPTHTIFIGYIGDHLPTVQYRT